MSSDRRCGYSRHWRARRHEDGEPRSGSFYGGVLLRAIPRRQGKPAQIRNVLQLTAIALLDPVDSRRRVRFSVSRLRAESTARGRLRLLVPVTNRGNMYQRAGSRIAVRDSGGTIVAHMDLWWVEPEATAMLEAAGEFLAPDSVR